jgi:hypothetical protein
MRKRSPAAAIAALDPDSSVVTQQCVTAEQQNSSSSSSTGTVEYSNVYNFLHSKNRARIHAACIATLLARTCRVRYCCQQQQAGLFDSLLSGNWRATS